MRAVDLIVEGIDLADENTIGILADQLDDLGWSSVDDRTIATVYVDPAHDAVACAIDAAHRIEHALPHAVCVRVDDDLVGVSDIAQRTGVTREAVRTWVHGLRGPGGFPTTRGTVGAGVSAMRVWAWADVVSWLARHYGLFEEEPVLTWEQTVDINSHLQRVDHAIDEAWQRLGHSNVHADVLLGERVPVLEPTFVSEITIFARSASSASGFLPVGTSSE